MFLKGCNITDCVVSRKIYLQLLYAPVNSEDGSKDPPGLSPVVLESPPEKDVPLTDPFLDPREVYLRELFMPNRFSAHTLRKALGVGSSFVYP